MVSECNELRMTAHYHHTVQSGKGINAARCRVHEDIARCVVMVFVTDASPDWMAISQRSSRNLPNLRYMRRIEPRAHFSYNAWNLCSRVSLVNGMKQHYSFHFGASG